MIDSSVALAGVEFPVVVLASLERSLALSVSVATFHLQPPPEILSTSHKIVNSLLFIFYNRRWK